MRSALLVLIVLVFTTEYVISSQSVMWGEYENLEAAKNKKWIQLEKAKHDDLVDITVGLHLRNTDKFTSLLLDVSDPRSENYGNYWTQKEIFEFTSPPIDSVSAVYNWISSGSPLSIDVACEGGFITATFTVDNAMKLLSSNSKEPIEFFRFHHQNDETRTLIRCPSQIYIPRELQTIIQVIEGVNNFPYLRIKQRKTHEASHFYIITGDGAAAVEVSLDGTVYNKVTATVSQGGATSQTLSQSVPATTRATVTIQFGNLANYVPLIVNVTQTNNSGQVSNVPTDLIFDVFPSPFITPAVVNSLYFIPPGTKGTNIQNSQAVAEFDRQYYSPTDLATFSQLMGVPNPNVTVVGTNDPNKPRGESTLDIEWITAIGVGVPTYFWEVPRGFLLAWAISVADSANPPLVHSISYGEPEKDMMDSLLTRLNQEFQLLGVRGISIISTSGDLGSSDGTNDCKTDVPDYPSSSPWTTSLGASFITPITETPVCTGHNVYGIPIACDALSELPCAQDAGTGFTTGGGFSAKFARPSYQDAAVEGYLHTAVLPPSSYFNASGRGFNDVGALGFHILTYQGGEMEITGGTSASGPIFAGILGLLNDVQLNNGKAPLGFVNPWLYQTAAKNPQAFNSVISGDNKCRESGQACCKDGFVAQSGWNPLTGLGTPVYTHLKDSLP